MKLQEQTPNQMWLVAGQEDELPRPPWERKMAMQKTRRKWPSVSWGQSFQPWWQTCSFQDCENQLKLPSPWHIAGATWPGRFNTLLKFTPNSISPQKQLPFGEMCKGHRHSHRTGDTPTWSLFLRLSFFKRGVIQARMEIIFSTRQFIIF